MRSSTPNASGDGGSDDHRDPEESLYYFDLIRLLHPDGLACPRCRRSDTLRVHRRTRDPVVDFFCAGCSRVFNAWTDTVLQGTHRPPSQLFAILRAIVENTPTARLARELGCQRAGLVAARRRLIPLACSAFKRGFFDGRAVPAPLTMAAGD